MDDLLGVDGAQNNPVNLLLDHLMDQLELPVDVRIHHTVVVQLDIKRLIGSKLPPYPFPDNFLSIHLQQDNTNPYDFLLHFQSLSDGIWFIFIFINDPLDPPSYLFTDTLTVM